MRKLILKAKRIYQRMFKTKRENGITMTMIKINKPVMQQVEVSREEIVRDLIGTPKNAKFGFGDLVYVTTERNDYYGNPAIDNALGLVTAAQDNGYNPMTGNRWEKEVKKEDRITYSVTYKDSCGRRSSLSATADNLTAV